jgi:acyl transferase domain-containing protein/acyl carrier protein
MSNAFDGSEIAIVGMAGRFPGAKNTNEFWRNLRDGVESITFMTDEQLAASGVKSKVFRDNNYVKAAGLIEDFDCFDAVLFGTSAREAELMDPQHRILLEVAWEALENAGYDPDEYQGAIGVYAGATINTYFPLNILSNPDILNSLEDVQINLSNGVDFLTTRISYKLNLRGPSHVVQSACSSSLVAIHTACQSLLNDECDMALAGGVSANLKFRHGYRYVEGGMASPDGHCRAFDVDARGTVFSSGAGLVVLKPLSAALASRDYIHAIIKGSAVNNDGSLKVGYTAPSIEGQANVIVEALASAGVTPDTITYVEAHGTGTPMGDPIEIRALTKAFSTRTDKVGQCALGSVKTNIGHLDAAAGVAGLIKTVLSMEHGILPPSLHFRTPNPDTELDRTPFFVNTELRQWKANGPRRAGVSAFGVGGTNAHVILEEAPPRVKAEPGREWHLLTLSGATERALEQARLRLIEYFRDNKSENIADIAYTLHVGRKPLNHRLVVTTNQTTQGAVQDLDLKPPDKTLEAVHQGSEKKVVFLFPGQGAQYVNMGFGLYHSEPVFRDEVDRCSDLLNSLIGIDLRTVLYPKQNVKAAAARLNETRLTQPALFVIEYALARLWISAGVVPWAMIGHSVGEYAAACLAEVFSLETGLDLISERARLMSNLPEGEMVAVPVSEADIGPFLADGLSVATVNAPSQCVISGASHLMRDFKNHLDQAKIPCRPLKTSHAFHSQMMEPILEPFVSHLGRLKLRPPKIPYISNVTGTWITGEEATSPRYWASQLREPVRFGDGLSELFKATPDLALLEVGPGHSLAKLASRQSAKPPGLVRAASLSASDREQNDELSFIRAVGTLWSSGACVDWKAYHCREKRRRVPLPTYPFERRRYWIEPKKGAQDYNAVRSPTEKNPSVSEWFYIPSWKRTLTTSGHNYRGLAGLERPCLLFTNRSELELALAEQLKQSGRRVVEVFSRDNLEGVRGGYFIDLEQRESYRVLLEELGELPEHVVHTWSLTGCEGASLLPESLHHTLALGFYSLLYLAQAIAESGNPGSVRISVISDLVCAIVEDEGVAADKSTILAPCKVIPQEYANISCKLIDVARGQGQTYDNLASLLVAELEAESRDALVAYRGRQRWTQTFERVQPTTRSSTELLPEKGAYLITGGLDGIGFLAARHLLAESRSRLLFLEREGFPASEDWDRCIENHARDDELCRKILRAREIQAVGAEVVVAAADIAEIQGLESARSALDRLGGLNGVIYAPSEGNRSDFKAINEIDSSGTTSDRWIEELAGLEKLLSGRDFDFCVLISSLSSILGGLGSVRHASHYAYMDAFARNHNRGSQTPWMSVNWDARKPHTGVESVAGISVGLGRLAMTAEEGAEAFRLALTMFPQDQLIVSTAELSTRVSRWLTSGPSDGGAGSNNLKPSIQFHPKPKLESQYASPTLEVERLIADIWQRTLGVERIGVDDNFFDLGGDSLTAIQVASRLRQELEVSVPVVSVYEGLTIRSMVKLLGLDGSEGRSTGDVQTNGTRRDARVLKRREFQQKARDRKREGK